MVLGSVSALEDSLKLVRAAIPEGILTAPTEGREKLVGASMALMEVALREKNWDRVLDLADEIFELDPNNALAHKRKATAYYAKKEYVKSLSSLRAAYKYEREASTKRRLKSYINAMISLIEKIRDRKTIPPRVRPGIRIRPPKRKLTPDDIRRLYEAGVDLYARGQLDEALAKFAKILEIDPKNAQARRAQRRVKSEILRGQQR